MAWVPEGPMTSQRWVTWLASNRKENHQDGRGAILSVHISDDMLI